MHNSEISDEYLDLVDTNDHVIGKEKRSTIYTKKLSNFRVVNAFIRNTKNELWIPRRTANKELFPLCLDMSMGGHVASGESYEDALKRETQEELGLNIDQLPVHCLGHLTPEKDGVSAYMKVYELLTDIIPHYNKNDFLEYYFLTPQALIKMITNGEKVKNDLPKLIKRFYLDGKNINK